MKTKKVNWGEHILNTRPCVSFKYEQLTSKWQSVTLGTSPMTLTGKNESGLVKVPVRWALTLCPRLVKINLGL